MGGSTYHVSRSRFVVDERTGTGCALGRGRVKGRITERQLPLAERSIPGISQFHAEMQDKPATFLDLLWEFEGRRVARPSRRKRRTR